MTQKQIYLKDIIAWLKTKDPNERFKWNDYRGGCLFSQFMRHIGYEPSTHGELWNELHKKYQHIADADGEYSTFGEALARAESMRVSPVIMIKL